MSKRLTSGLVAAIAAVAMSIPAVGLANSGGVPNSRSKACKTHSNNGKHNGKRNGTRGHRNGIVRDKGKKCGFPSNGQTGQTGSTGGTGLTGTTGSTMSTTHSHSHGHNS